MKDYRNWQTSFLEFPKIPKSKLWLPKQTPGLATNEQIIGNKLINGLAISPNEVFELKSCIQFYKVLLDKLKNFEYTILSAENIDYFLGYIGYALNYTLIIANDYHFPQLYRVVRNNNRQRKTNISQVSYPPMDIVRTQNRFNRANSPDYTVFYGSETIDTCFAELKPNVADVVTVGIWKPKKLDGKITTYPVSANAIAQLVNPEARSAEKAFNVMRHRLSILLNEFLTGYYDIFNYEFSKTVKTPYEYAISSMLSKDIFMTNNPEFDIGAILYPSIGHDYFGNNIAILPDVFDSNFHPDKVFEYEVVGTKSPISHMHHERGKLNFVQVKINAESSGISSSGDITWKEH